MLATNGMGVRLKRGRVEVGGYLKDGGTYVRVGDASGSPYVEQLGWMARVVSSPSYGMGCAASTGFDIARSCSRT